MVGFEGELDVQLVSDVEGEVEVGVGVDAVIAGVDGSVVDFGKGGDGVANVAAGLCYGRNEGSGKGVQSREAHGGAGSRGFVVNPVEGCVVVVRWNQARRRRSIIRKREREGKGNAISVKVCV